MTERDFIFWLRGFLSAADCGLEGAGLSSYELDAIQAELAKVQETPPARDWYGPHWWTIPSITCSPEVSLTDATLTGESGGGTTRYWNYVTAEMDTKDRREA